MNTSNRMKTTRQVLQSLHEIVMLPILTELERDGLIHRFEICFDMMWKCGKDYLLDRDGLAVASPKKVIRTLQTVGVLTVEETEQALQMANDRNMTAHIYDEKYAIQLAERIAGYEKLMQVWYKKMLE